jgi:hypothetical protein
MAVAIVIFWLVATSVSMGVIGNVPDPSTKDLFWAVLPWWVLVTVLALVASIAGLIVRARAETAAGYTITNGDHPELDLVDSKTGVVLRPAGEALLDRESFKLAQQAARSQSHSRYRSRA